MTTPAHTENGLHRFRPSQRAEPKMANGLAFLIHELRRHTPTLVLAFLVFAALPVVSRLIEGDWRFWDGIRNALAAALAVYVLAPFLTLMMAATGWPRERSLNLLDSLYARPLSSRTIFVYRGLAIAIATSIWIVLVLAFARVRWFELAQVLANLPGLPGPIALLIVGIGLGLGAGLLTSALAPSMDWAVRWSAILVIAVWLTALALPRVVGTAVVLGWAEFSSRFLAAVVTAFVVITALLLLALAWRAMSLAPDGPGRTRRVLVLGAPAAVTVIVLTAATLHLPRLGGPESPRAVWVGEGSSITFSPARGIARHGNSDQVHLSHPIVRSGESRKVLRDVYAVRYRGFEHSGPWIEPSLGLAMIPAVFHDLYDWVLIDRSGDATPIRVASLGEVWAIGWSPAGARFAWKSYQIPGERARIVVFEHGGTTRQFEVGAVTAYMLQSAWIDERTLLLTARGGSTRERGGWWTTLDVESGVVGARQELQWSQLTAPGLIEWDAQQSRLPVLDGAAVALFGSDALTNLWRKPEADPAPLTLVRPDPATGMLLPGPELPEQSLWTSFGSLEDGSLVWAAPEKFPRLPHWDGGARTSIYRLAEIDGEPEVLCAMPTGGLFGFIGESGSWLVWDTGRLWRRQGASAPEYVFWGCNQESKEGRVLTEWSEWAHPQATISDRGLFTASGWVPLNG